MPGPNAPYTKLDSEQTITQSFVESKDAHRVLSIAGSFVPEEFDEIDLTYVTSGNGVGEIETVTYSKNNAAFAVLTLSYNVSNQLTNVTRTNL